MALGALSTIGVRMKLMCPGSIVHATRRRGRVGKRLTARRLGAGRTVRSRAADQADPAVDGGQVPPAVVVEDPALADGGGDADPAARLDEGDPEVFERSFE